MRGLKKDFDENHVLRGIDYDIYKGQKIVLVGPSGCGKSTFLRCLDMLETPTAGEVWLGDTMVNDPKTDINKIRQRMGMVFQHFNLFPNMTILRNMTLAPIKLKGMSKKEAGEKARGLLRRVGLEDRADSYPSQLSGGQQQRIAIVRALCMDPEVMLFDEPTSALDVSVRAQILNLLTDLKRDLGLSMIFISH
ncbi:MAG TPA: glutamine ABC transporter ATP-binding protein, partial [Lachnospiraceae bacterium]|nr:glutamine ABC transporter ATP-binding protein [Lachnospiraceae bacterium]